MAAPKTIKGGKVVVSIGDGASPMVYTAPCGFTSKSVQFSKGLEEVNLPDCDDPDKVNWIGRDASSLSISVSGEGVAAAESIEMWLDSWESIDSVPVKIQAIFPAETYTWTGFMQVENLEVGAPNGQRVTLNVTMQSDGEMVRTSA